MMRKTGLVVIVAVITLIGGSRIVGAIQAEGPIILTEAQSQAIADSCNVSKIALGDVHSNDAVTRVNLGQDYVNISSRLMAPFNSRVGLAGRDGVELTKIATEYNQVLQQFRAAYSTYDDTVSKALTVDCRKDQAGYYASIMAAREERQKVRQLIDRLDELAKEYRKEVDVFSQEVK